MSDAPTRITVPRQRRILVVGGGIAGVESALVLARGLPDSSVTLLAHGPLLRVAPDLLYVPLGVSPQRVDVPLRPLLTDAPVEVVFGEVERVDLDAGVAYADSGALHFDLLVAAPGAAPVVTSVPSMQDLSSAVAVADQLDGCFAAATTDDARPSIVIRAAADDAWSPPGIELALLLARRRRALGLEHAVSITCVTADREPVTWFGPEASDLVTSAAREAGIELATGIPEARFDDLAGDVTVEFGRLEARHLPGLPGRDARGWYAVDADGRVDPRAFVVGDAVAHGCKAAFAATWQARRMLLALGGSLEALGPTIAGVPSDTVEHQLDLGSRTLRIRMPVAAPPADPWLGHNADVELLDGPPDRLAGLLVRDPIHRGGGGTAAQASRALATRRELPPLPGARRRRASSPTP